MNTTNTIHISHYSKIISLSILLPMLAWAVHLFGLYVVAEWICLEQPKGIIVGGISLLIVISIASSIVCVLGALVAFNLYRRITSCRDQSTTNKSKYRLSAFIVACTGLMSAFLLITIVIQSLPIFLAPIC